MFRDSSSNYNSYNSGYGGGRSKGYSNSRRGFGQNAIEEMKPSVDAVAFKKNFYNPTVTLTESEAREFRENNEMKLIGKNIPLPIKDFSSINFPSEVLRYFESKGYSKPTPIQAQGWPMALQGQDVVGIADTGSGKTISFVLPALMHAKDQEPLRPDDGPIALILAPTRELVTQIEEVVREYCPFFDLRCTSVYGGVSVVPQKKTLKRGVEILVATPGRLIDLHNQGFCPLNRVSFLVLDEADRMLDMGFEPQLNQIIPLTNKDRQSLMWSATWPREVRNLAMSYMSDFIQVTIGDDNLKANAKIVQKVEVVEQYDKKNKLLFYLQDRKSDRIIIFCNMKRTCDVIEDFLLGKGFPAAAIHGDKTQAARDTVISNFKAGRRSILIATDVAARGLDVENVKLVINYDFPKQVEDYVHRIGRTARGNVAEGHSFTMFTNEDSPLARKFIDILAQSNQPIPHELEALSRNSRGSFSQGNRSGFNSRGGRGRSFNDGRSYGDNRSYSARSDNRSYNDRNDRNRFRG